MVVNCDHNSSYRSVPLCHCIGWIILQSCPGTGAENRKITWTVQLQYLNDAFIKVYIRVEHKTK